MGKTLTMVMMWAAGSNAHYREYPDAGHNVWTATYRDAYVLKWLFKQRRNPGPHLQRRSK